METLKKLSQQTFMLVVFFSGITGAVFVTILLCNADALIVGFSVGESIDVRLSNIKIENAKTLGFLLGYIVILLLNCSIVVTRYAVRIDIMKHEGDSKTYAKNQNSKLDKLGDMLCVLSVLMSMTSVGVFMFAGMTLEQFYILITTPLFYIQLILFLSISLGVPSSISVLSTYVSTKYESTINNLIKIILEKVDANIKQWADADKKQKPQTSTSRVIDFNKFKNRNAS